MKTRMWSSSSSVTGGAAEDEGLPASSAAAGFGLTGLPEGGLLAPRGLGPGEDGLAPGESSSFRAPAGVERLDADDARGLGESLRRELGEAARLGSGIAVAAPTAGLQLWYIVRGNFKN